MHIHFQLLWNTKCSCEHGIISISSVYTYVSFAFSWGYLSHWLHRKLPFLINLCATNNESFVQITTYSFLRCDIYVLLHCRLRDCFSELQTSTRSELYSTSFSNSVWLTYEYFLHYRFKDRVPILDDQHIEVVTEEDDTSALLIKDAFPEDSGYYLCQASNSAGTAVAEVQLIVEGKPVSF